jgi:hypothetical protein
MPSFLDKKGCQHEERRVPRHQGLVNGGFVAQSKDRAGRVKSTMPVSRN